MATQRTTKKKAAKKTFPSARKNNLPKLKKKSTVEELAAVMAESHAKTEAAIADLTKSHAKTEATVDRVSKEVEKLSIENEKTLIAVRESSIRSDKAIAEIHVILDRMEDSFGGVSKRLGDLTEIIVVPKIRVDVNKLGNHNFTAAVADKTITAVVDGIKTPVAEVDMLLFGVDEAMAVEIKAHLKRTKVDTHIKRLQKLRTYEKEVGITDKKLFGAVAGVLIDNDAKEYATEKGLYVVEIREEENKLDITKPETCRAW